MTKNHNLAEDAWLGLGDLSKLNVTNPLTNRTPIELDNPGLREIALMTDPNYLAFTAETLLGIELLPIQAAILQELWIRPFPMFVGSRGLGKATRLDELVHTPDGPIKMGDVKIGDQIYGKDGLPHSVIGLHPQGKKQVYRVKLADGRSVDCCEDHLWVILDTGQKYKEKTLSTKQMFKNKLRPGTGRSYYYRYHIPNCEPVQYECKDLPLDPYLLGCLLGDGTMTTRTPKIASDDSFIIEEFRSKLKGFEIKKDPTNNNYTLVDRNKDATQITKKSGITYTARTTNRLTNIIQGLNLNVKCDKKFIPNMYKYSSIEQRMELVRGLLDTDGSITKDGAIEFTNVNEILIDDLMGVLRSLGIRCQKGMDDRSGQFQTMPNGTVRERTLCFRIFINTSKHIFKLPRKCERTKTKSTYAEKAVPIVAIEKLSKCVEMQCITVDNPDHTYITTDYVVTHNSFLLALYAMLKCILVPNSKIVIVGAAFRQSKIIFAYMETIWDNAPILKSICNNLSGPRKDTDRWTMRINDSWAISIPLGDGSKIRGLRAHTIISDEFNCTGRNTLIETNNGLERIVDLMNKDNFSIVNKDGVYETPENNIVTPPCDVYEIKTEYGYSFKCSKNHIVMTQNGWKKAVELTDTDYIISDNKYQFPDKQVQDVDETLAWLMGVLVAEGSVTNKNYVSVTSIDKDFADRYIDAGRKLGLDPKLYTQDAYTDPRGWKCQEQYVVNIHNTVFRRKLLNLGLDYVTAHNKKVPWSILKSPKNVVAAFLSGLFEGDGSCFTFDYKDKENRLACAYYTVSDILAQDLQTLMLKFDIVCQRQTRDSKISDNIQWMLRFNGEQALAVVNLLNIQSWKNIASKAHVYIRPNTYGTVYLKDTNRYKASIPNLYGKRNYYIGKYKTQEEAIEAVGDCLHKYPRGFRVKSVELLPEQEVLYDFYLPKTHSFYGNGFVQHNSIPPDIYETVVAGFTAVSADPISNVKAHYRREEMMKDDTWDEDSEVTYQTRKGNQSILSGTAGYDFQHFADYWKRYCKIIKSQGDLGKLQEVLGDDANAEHFNWKDYSVIRIPYELIPTGFMDDKQVARSKATVHSGIYAMEYGSVFTADSDGFFRRTLIERCVTSDQKPVSLPSGDVWFDARIRGMPGCEYVYGIDPASEKDNFSIIVLELHKDHSRLVYGWSTNRNEFKKRVKIGLADKFDFYGFCARKIRGLMKIFPCAAIALDAQGGGIAVEEALHDPDKMEEGELPIWPVIDDEKEKPTDIEPGLHILHVCQFAKADWTAEANHGLKKDFEDRVLLFPRFDSASLAISAATDDFEGRQSVYDTLEDCVMEIEALKDELCTIVHTRTGTGVNARDRWDTPEIKMASGKKGRLRKDRYSSLVMANMIARGIHRTAVALEYEVIGGFAKDIDPNQKGDLYQGPEWFTSGMNEGFIGGVPKNNDFL